MGRTSWRNTTLSFVSMISFRVKGSNCAKSFESRANCAGSALPFCFRRSKGVAGRSYKRRLRLPCTSVRRCFITGQKEVAKPAPLLCVKIIEQLGYGPAFQPPVADQLAHVSPIFLLHTRVVVLAISARASEAHRGEPFVEVIKQMPVEELAAIIGVEAQYGEGQRGFHLCDACEHFILASIPNRAALGPLAMHSSGGDGPAKPSRHRLAAVGHAVGLDVARGAHIPMFGANRNLTAQQCAGRRPAAAAASQTRPAWSQEPIDCGRADRQQIVPQ